MKKTRKTRQTVGFWARLRISSMKKTIGFGKSTADVIGIHISHINLEKADLVVDVLVKNPNPIPIPLSDINYLIESDGRKIVSGLIPDAGTIHAHGSETVQIPVCLIYDDIKSTYDDIKPGSMIPYRIKVDLIVDVPIFGRLTLPLEKKGEIPIPYKPDIDVEKIHFEKFSFEETIATLVGKNLGHRGTSSFIFKSTKFRNPMSHKFAFCQRISTYFCSNSLNPTPQCLSQHHIVQ